MDLLASIETFFKPLLPLNKPLLVGYSGGEDSLSLVRALEALDLPFELAHYDHGWREESALEAQALKEAARVPFHVERCSAPVKSELLAREGRYQFFERLFATGWFSALALGHHQNDQAETVLKRALEGSHLSTLKGIAPISNRGEMPIWRPMLRASKREILHFLNGEQGVDDATNRDPRYLRARMRQRILPLLSEQFGKEVVPALSRLGDYGAELESYLEKVVESYTPTAGPFGLMWDFSTAHPFEIRAVLHRFFSPSRFVFEQIIDALCAGRPNVKVEFDEEKLICDRGHLFWIKVKMPTFEGSISMEQGTFEKGDWTWSIRSSPEDGETSWHSWWKGKVSLTLPEGKYQLGAPNGKFKKEWNEAKIPAFLRRSLPIIEQNGEPIAHFFKPLRDNKNFSKMMSVNIEVKQKVCYTGAKG